MSQLTAALQVVAGTDYLTHLVGSSPAIAGCRPNDTTALCGVTTTGAASQPVYEVECGNCLSASTRFWELPSWTEGVYLS